MTRESTDTDTAEQVIDSFRILAADKVCVVFLNISHFEFLLFSLIFFLMNYEENYPQTRPSTVYNVCHHTRDLVEYLERQITCPSPQLFTENLTCKQTKHSVQISLAQVILLGCRNLILFATGPLHLIIYLFIFIYFYNRQSADVQRIDSVETSFLLVFLTKYQLLMDLNKTSTDKSAKRGKFQNLSTRHRDKFLSCLQS